MESKNADTAEQCFEPLGRCRAFTWHGNLNEYGPAAKSSPPGIIKNEIHEGNSQKDEPRNMKKPSTRRNAWGCMSYADLITKAIESVPEKRLTLSQIYSWMIQNVPYFKDKGESNSSAGWKNSIRHNLSLHRKFMRVQNEGTGKSSWWIINNEAKTCKSPRRRAASMDKNYEKKKHRQATAPPTVQQKNLMADYPQLNAVPQSSEVHKLDSFAAAFSPVDLRANGRTISLNATHLSPIGPIPESPFNDQVMTQPSPLYWNQCQSVNPPYCHPESLTETVGESLAELFTPELSGGSYEPGYSPEHRLTLLQNVNDKYISDSNYLPFQDLGVTLPSPPPYAGQPVDQQAMTGTSEGLFQQVNTEMCPKEMLHSPGSNSQSDAFPGIQYMSRSASFGRGGQNVTSDIAAMQQYYAERNGKKFASEMGSDSVLRQMLLQGQQKNVQISGMTDPIVAPTIKSEAETCDQFAYPDAQTSMICSGVGSPDDAGAIYANMESTHNNELSSTDSSCASRIENIESQNVDDVIKQENQDAAWDFSAGLASTDDSKN